ncbi:MAG: class I SAM-dependent methyltransferase [Candidatus Saccharimonadales bacterium]
MIHNLETQRKIERTGRSVAFYKKVFGDVIAPENTKTILDVGAGDSSFANNVRQLGQSVTRVDMDYINDPPEGTNWIPADATNLEAFRSQYDVVISVFMMQHLNREDQSKALENMIEATVERNDDSFGYQGVVGIYPVYKSEKLRALIDSSGFYGRAVVVDTAAPSMVQLSIKEQANAAYSTLLIVNDDTMNESRKRDLAMIVASSDALTRRTTISDIARRAFMKPGVNRRG